MFVVGVPAPTKAVFKRWVGIEGDDDDVGHFTIQTAQLMTYTTNWSVLYLQMFVNKTAQLLFIVGSH